MALSLIAASLPNRPAAVNPPRCGTLPVASCAPLAYLWGRNAKRGPMITLYQALTLILDVVWFVMIAHIILSWLINFQVLNVRQPLVAQIWYGLTRLLDPLYTPIRRVLPNMGGLDLAPLVMFVIVIILQRALINNAGFFYGF
jgi:YggT family protein